MIHLLNHGQWILSSGKESSLKIDCDALTDDDIWAVAKTLMRVLPPFGEVRGIPMGGQRLERVLRERVPHHIPDLPLLLVDDVWTTGLQMGRARTLEFQTQTNARDVIGAVVFARGRVPDWVYPMFTLDERLWSA